MIPYENNALIGYPSYGAERSSKILFPTKTARTTGINNLSEISNQIPRMMVLFQNQWVISYV
jgi:hypothetical protein